MRDYTIMFITGQLDFSDRDFIAEKLRNRTFNFENKVRKQERKRFENLRRFFK